MDKNKITGMIFFISHPIPVSWTTATCWWWPDSVGRNKAGPTGASLVGHRFGLGTVEAKLILTVSQLMRAYQGAEGDEIRRIAYTRGVGGEYFRVGSAAGFCRVEYLNAAVVLFAEVGRPGPSRNGSGRVLPYGSHDFRTVVRTPDPNPAGRNGFSMYALLPISMACCFEVGTVVAGDEDEGAIPEIGMLRDAGDRVPTRRACCNPRGLSHIAIASGIVGLETHWMRLRLQSHGP